MLSEYLDNHLISPRYLRKTIPVVHVSSRAGHRVAQLAFSENCVRLYYSRAQHREFADKYWTFTLIGPYDLRGLCTFMWYCCMKNNNHGHFQSWSHGSLRLMAEACGFCNYILSESITVPEAPTFHSILTTHLIFTVIQNVR